MENLGSYAVKSLAYDEHGLPIRSQQKPLEENLLHKDKVLRDLLRFYNQDLLCRKLQRWPLVPMGSLQQLIDIAGKDKDEKALVLSSLKRATALCALFPDNLFFAGGFFLHCLSFRQRWSRNKIPDVDFFIVAETEQEAIHIITTCLQHLQKEKHENDGHFISRSKGALTYYEFEPSDWKDSCLGYYDDLLRLYNLKFQFIHRLYSHPSQIVGMFDLPVCGVLYSDRKGFMATPFARYCLRNFCMFIDPTRLSSSFRARLCKYMERGFRVFIPNAFDSDELKEFKSAWDFNDYIQDWRNGYDFVSKSWTNKTLYHESDYQENDRYGEIFLRPLYYHVPLMDNLSFLVKEEDFTVDLEKMMALRSDFKKKLYPSLDRIDVKILRNTFSGNELREALEIFALEDENEARLRWEKIGESLALARQEELVSHFKPYSEGGFFKIANPGEQGGGSFSPTVKSGREFWNLERVKPLQVGLSHEVYWLLREILAQNTQGLFVPKDIFNLLCTWCVIAQAC